MTPFDVEKDFVQPTAKAAGVYRESAAPECPKRHPTEVPALWRSLALGVLVAGFGYAGGMLCYRAADTSWPFGVLASTAIMGGLAALGMTQFFPWLVTGPHELSPCEREQYAFWRRIHPVRALKWILFDPRYEGLELRAGWGLAFCLVAVAAVISSAAFAACQADASRDARDSKICAETCTTLGTRTLTPQHVDSELRCRCADRSAKRLLVVTPDGKVYKASR